MKEISIIGNSYHTDDTVIGIYSVGDRMRPWGKYGAFWGGFWGITPANASLQVHRVAKARGALPGQIAALVEQHISYRRLGILGESRVNVLELNRALEKDFPQKQERS